MGKDKKHKKEKHKKDKSKKRKREHSSDSSDSEEERRKYAEKKAKQVAEYQSRMASKLGAPAKFVWQKKIERDLQHGKSVKDFTMKAEQERHRERMSEIEKVQKRREEREAEKARMEEELNMLQRQRAAAEAAEQEEKEELFHLEQAQARAARRLAQGRAKPIDLLARDLYNIRVGDDTDEAREAPSDDDDEEEWGGAARRAADQRLKRGTDGPGLSMMVPSEVFQGLMLEDMEQLYDDVRGFKELDYRDPLHAQYWEALLVLVGTELKAARARDEADKRALRHTGGGIRAVTRPGDDGGSLGPGVHSALHKEIEALLAGQSHAQLRDMEKEINRQLAAGQGDPEYWEAVLERLQVHAAKAQLRELQAQLLSNRLAEELAKVDVAKAMGWQEGLALEDHEGEDEGEEEEEDEEQAEQERLGEPGRPFPSGTAVIVDNEEEIPLSDEEEEQEGAAAAAAAAAGPSSSKQAAGEAAGDAAAAAAAAEEPASPRASPSGRQPPGTSDDEGRPPPTPPGGAAAAAAAAGQRHPLVEPGRWSPPPVDPAEVVGLEVVNEEEDQRMLQLLRQQVRVSEASRFINAAEVAARLSAQNEADRVHINRLLDPRNVHRTHPMLRNVASDGGGMFGLPPRPPTVPDDPQTAQLKALANRAMGGDGGDMPFGGEVAVPIDSQVYWWHNKYAPRKPKYFNRVHTGYEWNKYNQTHYDTDNPPPKVVQGYKFNIFYPDLVDKTKAPSYRVEPDPAGGKDTCILVFSAGPPYEDIAFRIVNKEWETTHRRGFKCNFDRGILHLYFNFKRARYRR